MLSHEGEPQVVREINEEKNGTLGVFLCGGNFDIATHFYYDFFKEKN